MKKLLIILLLIFFQCAKASIDIKWEKTYGGKDIDVAKYVQQTKDGGYIIVGKTISFSSGKFDIWLIKTDSKGNEEWNRTFGGIYEDFGSYVHQTIDGGYIIAGTKTNAENSDIWLIKTDSKGNEEWNRTFDSSAMDKAFFVKRIADGYIIVGDTKGNDINFDIWLIKIDDKGNKEWDKAFKVTKFDDTGTFVIDEYIIGGYTGYHISKNTTESNAWIIKVDSYGNEEWNRTFGDVGIDKIYSATYDNGFVFVGVKNFNKNGGDLWIIKTDDRGNKEWEKVYGGKDGEVGKSIKKTDDGYIIVGYTYSYGAGKSDAWLIKVDKDGNEKWNLTIGGESFDYGECVEVVEDGYVIAGYTFSYGAGRYDAWLIKVVESNKKIPSFNFFFAFLAIILLLLRHLNKNFKTINKS